MDTTALVLIGFGILVACIIAYGRRLENNISARGTASHPGPAGGPSAGFWGGDTGSSWSGAGGCSFGDSGGSCDGGGDGGGGGGGGD